VPLRVSNWTFLLTFSMRCDREFSRAALSPQLIRKRFSHPLQVCLFLALKHHLQLATIRILAILRLCLHHGIKFQALRALSRQGGIKQIRHQQGTGLIRMPVVVVAKDQLRPLTEK